MEEKIFYQRGALKNGRRITYYENGKIKLIETYEHGNFVSRKEF